MIKSLLNNSDTALIVLHEIYGMNRHIQAVCKYYSQAGFDVICPDLMNNHSPFGYDQAEIAYAYFYRQIGFETAVTQVRTIITGIRKRYRYVFLLGFSIGATIAWICNDTNELCHGVIGYYGSRIRDYRNLTPKSPVLLLYPQLEKSFNVPELVHDLKNYPQVEIYILDGQHGFSDMFSPNYLQESHQKSVQLTADFLQRMQTKP